MDQIQPNSDQTPPARDKTPKKSEKSATQWFSFCQIEKKSSCKVPNCMKKLAGNSCSNQYRHLRLVHPKFFSEHVLPVKKANNAKKQKQNVEIPAIPVCINGEIVAEALVEMIGENGYPLNIIFSTGLRKLLDPILDGIKLGGSKFHVNDEFIKGELHRKANDIKEKIKSETERKLVTVMLDGATRHNRGILGVKIQYLYDGKIKVRNIGMMKVDVRHSSDNLYEMLSKMLLEYDIKPHQIFSLTNDNAYNMINITEEANAVINGEADSNVQLSDEDAEQQEIEDEAFYERLFENIAAEYEKENVNLVRCVAHTLQLIVKDALKTCKQTINLISKCRSIIKKLRTPTIYNHIKQHGLKTPKVDSITRWSSTYIMVCYIFIFLYI